MVQYGIITGVAATSEDQDSGTLFPSESQDSPAPVYVSPPKIPEAVWYGRNYLLDKASDAILERFLLIFHSPFNEGLAKLLLQYYASDLWSCLRTSGNYVETSNITIEDFAGTRAITKVAKVKNGVAMIDFTRMKNDTVRRYFELIFPRHHEHIKIVAGEIVNSTSPNRLKDIDIRTAYALAMRNREVLEGVSKIERFHTEVLYPEFRAHFRVMAYIGPDGKHVVTNGRLRFGIFPNAYS